MLFNSNFISNSMNYPSTPTQYTPYTLVYRLHGELLILQHLQYWHSTMLLAWDSE